MALSTPQTREGVLENVTRIKHLLHDPTSFMTELLVQQQQYTCLHWLCHFDVLSNIPLAPATISYNDLSRKLQVPERTLRAATRMVMTMGFLQEPVSGQVSHNSLSAPFIENPQLKVWLLHLVNQTVPVMGGMIPATERYGATDKVNQTAYNVVMNTELSFFAHLKSQPDLEKEFDDYMRSQASAHEGVNVKYLLQGFDWLSLPHGGMVVDVGGGSGEASIALAKVHQNLSFVVQDQPGPIANARVTVSNLPPHVSERIELQEHDFFTPQPVKHADIYLLRMIMHDWPDEEAIKILEQLAQAMRPESRILIMDMVIPEPGSGSRIFEAALRQKELSMMQAFNARERDETDWYSLIAKVGGVRLRINAIRRPEGCQHAVIEVGFGGEAISE